MDREGLYVPKMTKSSVNREKSLILLELSKRKSNKQGANLLSEYKPETPSTIKCACWVNIIFIALILILVFLSI